jgi:adenosylcobinamide-phosphate synthase
MVECAVVLLVAGMLDLSLGDPVYPYHPVRLAGKIITASEALLRRMGLSGIAGGLLLVVMVSSSALGCYLGVRLLISRLHPWPCLALDVYVAYSCLSLKDLIVHAKRVSAALKRDDLAGARHAVQRMVGRNATLLDASGVARATVESTAENFTDGFLSPLFWYGAGCCTAYASGINPMAGAVTGMLAYKTVNTLDSMVGYRSPEYLYFGRASARLDDVMNYVPARLSIPIMCIASCLCGLNAWGCLRIGLRDRLKHTSPNAGHAESCAAGALGIRLGGPTRYPFGLVEKPWLGDGSPDFSHDCIDEGCILVLLSGLISLCAEVFLFIALSLPGAHATLP